jgi:hypothetical protein
MTLSLPELREARELICRMRALLRQDSIDISRNRKEVDVQLQAYMEAGTTIHEVRAAERSIYEDWFSRNPNYPRAMAG